MAPPDRAKTSRQKNRRAWRPAGEQWPADWPGTEVTGIGAAGFEPTTPTTPKWCATKLRYAPVDTGKRKLSQCFAAPKLAQ